MKRLIAALLFLYTASHAQQASLSRNSFLGQETQQGFDFWNITQPSTTFHSSMRPYLSSAWAAANDSAVPFKWYGFNNTSNTLFRRNDSSRFGLQVLPLLELEPGYDMLAAKSAGNFAGGAHLKMTYTPRFTLSATLLGGVMKLPFYADTVLSGKRIIPEFGQAYGTNEKGYQYSDFTGYASYTTANKIFNFQAGRDKHFIGEGYRSVLLSDYAAANPYFKLTVNVWRLQYSVWYSWLNDVTVSNGIKSSFRNKYGAFHYLSYNVTRHFNIGIFENVIWRGSDTSQSRTFDVNYLNPVVFYRPQEYSVGSPDNSFLGLNMSATIFRKLKLYGQLGLDEFYLKEIKAGQGWWANKQAWQLGLKYVNALGIKGLKLQGEYNVARPYTYSHGLVDQNYGHYGMALAHPLGANFREIQGSVLFRKGRWSAGFQLMYAMVGRDTAGSKYSMGQNIFRSYSMRPYEYGHYTTQGVTQTIAQSHVKLTWYLRPELNMRLEMGYIQRSESDILGYKLDNPYLYLGFKTSFWNTYRDF